MTNVDREQSVMSISELESTPLGRLLGGVNARVFGKQPRVLGLRTLHRDMSTVLGKLRDDSEYRVLTNRGVPSFLLIPIDPNAWSSLLAAAAPDSQWMEERAARDEDNTSYPLSDLPAVLEPLRDSLR
jgi:hypothetical protein